MPANFPQAVDDAAAAVNDTTATSTGIIDAINDFVRSLVGRDANNTGTPFGSAALIDAGTGAGQIPQLDGNARLANALLPDAIDVDEVQFNTAAGFLAAANRRGVNGDMLLIALTWVFTDSTLLLGASRTTTVDRTIRAGSGGSAGTAFALGSAGAFLDYQQFELRYRRAGQSTIRTELVPNTLGSTAWAQVSDATGDVLEYRFVSRNTASIELRAPNTGYRLLSVYGVNPIIGGDRFGADLSLGARTGTTLQVRSSSGDDVTLPAASATQAGLVSAADQARLANAGAADSPSVFNSGLLNIQVSSTVSSRILTLKEATEIRGVNVFGTPSASVPQISIRFPNAGLPTTRGLYLVTNASDAARNKSVVVFAHPAGTGLSVTVLIGETKVIMVEGPHCYDWGTINGLGWQNAAGVRQTGRIYTVRVG